ncbi:hypothetical protein DRN62_03495 [Nanoarchaeota archaeon]|nr:MAG: hypothetical protein DRN62_03495 [Nanoarchaeota archaeon]
MKYGILAREVMTRKPITISPDATVYDAVKKMVRNRVGSVLVVEGKKLLGILTYGDVMKRIILAGKSPKRTKVSKVMTKRCICVEPWDDLYDVVRVMYEKDVKRLPVVEDGKLVGLVTIKDIIRVEPHVLDVLIEKIRVREPERKPLFRGHEYNAGVCEICGNYSDKLEFKGGMWVCPKCSEEMEK